MNDILSSSETLQGAQKCPIICTDSTESPSRILRMKSHKVECTLH